MESEKHCSTSTTVLQERISAVEKSINVISSLREELDENSKNVKTEVQTSIGAQLHRLRQREIQLLRQVDALISHQSCLLQLQLSRLYQSLGALRSTLQWVKQGGNLDLSMIGDITLSPVPIHHLHFEPTSQPSLESSIQCFGRVEAKGASANVLMLPDEEDYGDGDHHVLHKALDSHFTSKIEMRFPKIASNYEDWLTTFKAKSELSCHESKTFLRDDILKEEKWLRDLEGQFDLDDFEMTEVSETSESIELLSHPEVHNNNLWLQSPVHGKDNNSMCNCVDQGNVEIENLDTLNCMPFKTSNTNKADTASLLVPEVSAVCRSSNSKCKTFDDCLCNSNCLVTCLKEQMKDLKMQDSTKQDCINEVIRATCKQQKNHNSYDWLAREEAKVVAESVGDWLKLCAQNNIKSNDVDDWLKVCSNGGPQLDINSAIEMEDYPRFELPHSLIGFQAVSWLTDSESVNSDVEKSQSQSGSWLSYTRTPVDSENTQTKAVKEMFAAYFQQQTLGNWVAHKCDNKIRMEWLASCP